MDMRIDGRGNVWSPNGQRIIGRLNLLDYIDDIKGPGDLTEAYSSMPRNLGRQTPCPGVVHRDHKDNR